MINLTTITEFNIKKSKELDFQNQIAQHHLIKQEKMKYDFEQTNIKYINPSIDDRMSQVYIKPSQNNTFNFFKNTLNVDNSKSKKLKNLISYPIIFLFALFFAVDVSSLIKQNNINNNSLKSFNSKIDI